MKHHLLAIDWYKRADQILSYEHQTFICLLKYLSPVGSMIKFWMTSFWFMKVAWLWCFMFYRNQKVVTENFIIGLTSDKYFSKLPNMYFFSSFILWGQLKYLNKRPFENFCSLNIGFPNGLSFRYRNVRIVKTMI